MVGYLPGTDATIPYHCEWVSECRDMHLNPKRVNELNDSLPWYHDTMIPWYHGEGKWQRFIFSKLRDGLGSLVSLFWGWRWFIRGKPGAVLAACRQLFRSFSAACPQLFHSFSAAYNPNIIDWHGIGKNKTPVSWQYHVSLLSSSSSMGQLLKK